MHRRALIVGVPAMLLLPGCVTRAAANPLPPRPIRDYIAAAADFARTSLPARWPGVTEVPFLLLLVGAEHEYLFYLDAPPEGFATIGVDEATGSPVHRRPRQFDPAFLATFPAIDGIATIVIGYPEATSQSDPAHWSLTLLHEHFHQRQYGTAAYYSRTLALDLSGGDETGVWMLNYAFPYDQAAVSEAFALASRTLHRVLDQGEAGEYLAARARLRQLLTEPDWRYFAFQVWQEGVARFAEIDLGLTANRADWRSAAQAKRNGVREDLTSPDLAARQRVSFYSYGAAEALLLDSLSPQWRADYFEGPLSLDRHFAALETG